MQFKSSEVLILLAASVMSFIANLPDNMTGDMVDKKVILAALAALVVVAMFRYLQMMLLLTISILTIGANLPAELADKLGISQLVLVISLGVLVGVTLLNRAMKLLPTGIEKLNPTKTENPVTEITDAREAMLTAIAKGDRTTLHHLLAMNANVNFIQNGTTPLHVATEKGYPDIVRILIRHGADINAKNSQGQTALDSALTRKKFVQTTEILFNANNTVSTLPGKAEPRRADAELWRDQHH